MGQSVQNRGAQAFALPGCFCSALREEGVLSLKSNDGQRGDGVRSAPVDPAVAISAHDAQRANQSRSLRQGAGVLASQSIVFTAIAQAGATNLFVWNLLFAGCVHFVLMCIPQRNRARAKDLNNKTRKMLAYGFATIEQEEVFAHSVEPVDLSLLSGRLGGLVTKPPGQAAHA